MAIVDAAITKPPPGRLRLRDGSSVSMRPVTSDDEAVLWRFLTDLSIGSRRLRFFGVGIDLRAEARRGAAGEDADHVGLLAEVPGRGIVGHAIYARMALAERAEVAVEVADDLHNLGLATLLMIRLAQLASERRISTFFAEVLPENQDMLAVFRDGFAAVTRSSQGIVHVEFPTSRWRAAHARFASCT